MQDISNLKTAIKKIIYEMEREEEINEYLRLKNKVINYHKRNKLRIKMFLAFTIISELILIASNQHLDIFKQVLPVISLFFLIYSICQNLIIGHFYSKIEDKKIEDITNKDISTLKLLLKI